MRYTFLLITSTLLLFFQPLLYGQNPEEYENFQRVLRKANEIDNRYLGEVKISDEELKSMDGSPYANKNFMRGDVFYDGKILFNDVLLRYNATSDQMQVKENEDDVYGAVYKSPIVSAKIGNNYYVVERSNIDNTEQYYRIVFQGENLKLYEKLEAKFYAPTFARTHYESHNIPEFKQERTYYVVINGIFNEVTSNKRRNFSIFDYKKKDIQRYIKNKDLNLRNVEDIYKILPFYDVLLSEYDFSKDQS